ncbi:hypothetical protein AVEN_119709-1, partial [Araneus ventricosus]
PGPGTPQSFNRGLTVGIYINLEAVLLGPADSEINRRQLGLENEARRDNRPLRTSSDNGGMGSTLRSSTIPEREHLTATDLTRTRSACKDKHLENRVSNSDFYGPEVDIPLPNFHDP